MPLILIVAVRPDNVIGIGNKLPWPPGSQPSDMEYFKEVTMGHSVIMGRKTWESIPSKYRPLPGRQNFVLTRSAPFGHTDQFRGAFVLNDLDPVLLMAKEEIVYVIGGAEIYAQFMPHADQILLTRVRITQDAGHADNLVYFPDINPEEWLLDQDYTKYAHEKGDVWPMSFFRYLRKK